MKMAKMTRKDADGSIGAASPPKSAKNKETVPYGLHLRLDHESLKKLGVTKLPKVGSKMHVHAIAHVHSIEESDRDEEGKTGKRRNMELHLHQMSVAPHSATGEEKQANVRDGAKAAMDKALSGDEEK